MKKTYVIPSIEMALFNPTTVICTSPGALDIIDQGTDGLGGGEGPLIGG